MTTTTKVGIIGAGGIGAGKHLPGHRRVEGVSIIAVCDIDEPKAKEFGQKHEIEHVFADYNDLLAMDETGCRKRVYAEQFSSGANDCRAEGGQTCDL